MKIGNREFEIGNRTYVMGILNMTPDSFSDGGKYTRMDEALFRVEEMLGEGMDILDIGGESTRPGYVQLSQEEEAARVIPVIEAVRQRFEVPISLDTYKYQVARAGIWAGADMINDIWGLKYDGRMASLLAETQIPCVLMHNRKDAAYEDIPCGQMQDRKEAVCEAFLKEVVSDLEESIQIAVKAGIPRDAIILDPGVGFGKTYEQNLQIIKHIDMLRGLGYPILLGTSRKSVIGLTLNLPVQERLEGTLATTVLGVIKGCSFVRVHDVKENVRAIRMAQAILYS